MARQPTPTLRRKELGTRLKQLRQDKGMTAEEVAERLMVSPTKISRLETASRVANLRDIRDLCGIYGVSDDERERLMTLARQGRESSWWQQYDLPYSTFVDLEAAATSIADYKSDLVPGLLQTQAYARAVLEGTLPDPTEDRIAQLMESRLMRQRLLTEEPAVGLWSVLDEGAIRRVMGSPATMAEQLRSLLDWASRPNVDIQVIPFEAGAHPALTSIFTILHFQEPAPDVVYVEGLLGNHYLESPGDLSRYRRVFDQLRAIALSPKDTLRILARLARDFAG